MCFLFVHFVVVGFFLFCCFVFVFVFCCCFFWGGGGYFCYLFVCLFVFGKKKVLDKYQICNVRQIQKIDLSIYMHHINDKPVEHPNANYMN